MTRSQRLLAVLCSKEIGTIGLALSLMLCKLYLTLTIMELAALAGDSAVEATQVAARLRSRSEMLMQSYHAVVAERSKNNAFSRDQDAVKKRCVKFDLRISDEVSFSSEYIRQ